MASLDDFPSALQQELPEFDSNGLLPDGDYAPSRNLFEDRFVNTGAVRQTIYAGWNRHRRDLLLAGLPKSARQLLDGSYTTAEPEPNDLDLAVEVPISSDEYATFSGDTPVMLLLRGSRMKVAYNCDAYAIPVLPREHPSYEYVTVGAIRYWTKWFGKTRLDVPKGRVWTTTGGFNE
jgi:hypothetical protein